MRLNLKQFLCFVLVMFSIMTNSIAHEMEPALLDIKQLTAQQFEINWRAPIYYKKPHPSTLVLPEHWQILLNKPVKQVKDSHLYSQIVSIGDSDINNDQIYIKNLESTTTEVFVRILWLDQHKTSLLVLPESPYVNLQGKKNVWHVAKDYMLLGISHILEGIDHLSFVLLIMWLVTVKKKLLITITAFTVAHSLTLAAASTGMITVPGSPVEALIALSIVFMASELLKIKQGGESLTAEYPWLVAFLIGLIHGLGFSGALQEIGLPEHDLLLALVTFNVGVELGQLLFIGAILLVSYVFNKIPHNRPAWLNIVPVYLLGSIASFWFIERVSQF